MNREMPTKTVIRKNEYRDSVALMRLATELRRLEGVRDSAAVMATPANLELVANAGLMTEEAGTAQPNDLVIIVRGETEESIDQALSQLDELVAPKEAIEQGVEILPRSLDEALAKEPQANIVLISTPGPHAASEAYRALQEGLHVFMFSDNVSIEDEVMLKQLARRRQLLMMGPDCGTAIINGHPLGFANQVRRGPIGIAAASGTGLQEVSSLIHRLGSGVSQAIGLGSHDLSEEVGGITMEMALSALAKDSETEIIVLLSKPPAPSVARKVLEQVERIKKPVVINFLGGDLREIGMHNATPAFTLEDAAALSVSIANGAESEPVFFTQSPDEINRHIKEETRRLTEGQEYIRGLFSGGTFTSEALLLLRDVVGGVYSNVTPHTDFRITPQDESRQHTILDLGADEYTSGRPHPMIDFRTRIDAIMREAADPGTAVILLDVVLGFGANDDPAGELIPTIREARSLAHADGRFLSIVASVCGTDRDVQDREAQVRRLQDAGVVVMESNAQAVRLAGHIARRQPFAGEGSTNE